MHPWVKGGLALLAAATVVFVLVAAGEVIELVVIASLLAYLLNPLVRRLEAAGLGRTPATSLVFAGVLGVAGLLLAGVWPAVLAQVQAVRGMLTPERVAALVGEAERFLEARLAFAGIGKGSLTGPLREAVVDYARSAVTYVPGLLGLLADLVIIPFLLFFLLKDGRTLRKSLIASVPNRYFEFALNLLHRMDRQLGNYLRGKLVASLVVAVLSTVALWGLGVEAYLILGPLNGLANLIPYVGPLAAAALTVVVALLGGATPGTVAGIVVALTLVQVVDNVLLNPLVVARNVALHPVTVLLAVIVGGQFFGVLGLLLAVPAAAVVKVTLQEVVRNARRYGFW
ncbi:AI-2E family transporter [Rhodocaloribacter litoris]|uniref:AI-2E family transporter n=1 Tax=Rhodocaloribacter litoris TaxID=2558931 RepID=UPI00141E9AB9|nr:AI-2E family transporter [Rhodocaloribacter litoris]QXD14241.1 AI-2E family transporter [Rhodocaloribacter litoris]